MITFTEQDAEQLKRQLRRDEGRRVDAKGRHVAYLDSLGILTVGYGHNCASSPVPGVIKPGDTVAEEQAEALFERDLAEHIYMVCCALPWIQDLEPARQAVLYNMVFNMGLGSFGSRSGLLSFRNTLRLVQEGKYTEASRNMLQSKWASQVGTRAIRLAQQMQTGEWQ